MLRFSWQPKATAAHRKWRSAIGGVEAAGARIKRSAALDQLPSERSNNSLLIGDGAREVTQVTVDGHH